MGKGRFSCPINIGQGAAHADPLASFVPNPIDHRAAAGSPRRMNADRSPRNRSWTRRANAFWDWLAHHFSMPGLLVGSVFFTLSLTPSLLPRTETVQGILSGCCFAVGYGIGNLGHWLWGILGLRVPPGPVTRALGIAVALVGLGLQLLALSYANTWQNSVRAVMQMPPVDQSQPLIIAAVAFPIAAAIMVVGKIIVTLIRLVWSWLSPHLPRRAALVLSTLLVAIVVAALVNNLFWRSALRAADGFYERLDALVATDDAPPLEPFKTGSAQSLIEWETIGKDSRIYIQSGPDAARISALTGRPAIEPLRTYVGLRSAPTVSERAQLAMDELLRIGAFERSVLVLVMPVGTGWVDRAGIDMLEYLHGGDVASVAVQYSYLTSALSLLVEPTYGAETAQALFDIVYAHWTSLPRENPPAPLSLWSQPWRVGPRRIPPPSMTCWAIPSMAPFGPARPFPAFCGRASPRGAIPIRPTGCPASAIPLPSAS
jgi:uncharacterized membrane protein